MPMYINQLDHLVLTVNDINKTILFYSTVLGMEQVTFGDNRQALRFGNQKINLHQHGDEIEPNAAHPTPGSADLCFLTDLPLDRFISYIQTCGVSIIAGPVRRTGATGTLLSVYFRDPDDNLLEVATRVTD